MRSENYEITLSFIDAEGATSEHTLGLGEYVLGRAPECDVCFPPDELAVSRKHARLEVTPEKVTIEDLESRRGTMVNGRFVWQQNLEKDDVITIGSYFITVNIPESDTTHKSAVVVQSAEQGTRDVDDLETELERLRLSTESVLAEVGKRIVGQEAVLRLIWATILTREHCLLVGVPGLAKTMMVTSFADALGLSSSRIQFTPDLMPSDIIGSSVIQETEDGKRFFEFVQGPIFTQLLLADEINRTPPKTQSALLEAMQERQVTVGNRSLSLPSPFCVVATQNPIEQEGTYPLPEAQQDRFMLCITLDYPERDEEVDILLRTTHGAVSNVSRVLDYREILAFQRTVERITAPESVVAYAADLVRATRPGQDTAPEWLSELVDWGAGPRAGQSVVRAAKAMAAMDGRPVIVASDIRDMAPHVLRHRVACNFRARAKSMDVDDVIAQCVAEVREP